MICSLPQSASPWHPSKSPTQQTNRTCPRKMKVTSLTDSSASSILPKSSASCTGLLPLSPTFRNLTMQRSRTARRLPISEKLRGAPGIRRSPRLSAASCHRRGPTASGHGNGSRARRHRTCDLPLPVTPLGSTIQAPPCGCPPLEAQTRLTRPWDDRRRGA